MLEEGASWVNPLHGEKLADNKACSGEVQVSSCAQITESNSIPNELLLGLLKPSEQLSQAQKQELEKLICDFWDVFSLYDAEGRTNLVQHSINTGDSELAR